MIDDYIHAVNWVHRIEQKKTTIRIYWKNSESHSFYEHWRQTFRKKIAILIMSIAPITVNQHGRHQVIFQKGAKFPAQYFIRFLNNKFQKGKFCKFAQFLDTIGSI